jgi:hypothetical protein
MPNLVEKEVERATNKLRKTTKNQPRWNLDERRRDIRVQEKERKQEANSRQEAVSRELSREASLHKPELFLSAMGHADGCHPVVMAP